MTIEEFKQAREVYNRYIALNEIYKNLGETMARVSEDHSEGVAGSRKVTISNDKFEQVNIDTSLCEDFLNSILDLCREHMEVALDTLGGM